MMARRNMDITQEIWIQELYTHRKMDCNLGEVQRITTTTTTYKRFYMRILILEVKLERTTDGFEKWETFQRIIDWTLKSWGKGTQDI
jgi:hypothetical protein